MWKRLRREEPRPLQAETLSESTVRGCGRLPKGERVAMGCMIAMIAVEKASMITYKAA